MTLVSDEAPWRAAPVDIARADRIEVTLDGRPLVARRGETVAAVLAANGVTTFRSTGFDSPRGLFCGMGVCQDCLVEVDGRANQRACMTKIDAPMAIRRQRIDLPLGVPGGAVDATGALSADIAVIGGGAAGLTAACVAAEAGASVLVIDERPTPGGQYFKQPTKVLDPPDPGRDDRQFAGGRRLLDRARRAGVRFIAGTVWTAEGPGLLRVLAGQSETTVSARRVIVATGAYERGLPVPGWTLPGVVTTGAAQTLLRSYRVLAGRRVLIAGNGPLNLQVALELAGAGADVVAVVEAAAKPGPWALGPIMRMTASAPDLAIQGAGYVRRLDKLGIPMLHGHVVERIDAAPGGLTVSLRQTGGERVVSVHKAERVALGYGFQPANELLRLFGCRHAFDAAHGQLATVRDADCRTSDETVFAAGDCTGLGGAFAAISEGIIAGAAAARDLGHAGSKAAREGLARARKDLRRHRRFQQALWSLYAADLPLAPCAPETVVCRCEEVTLGEIDAALEGGDVGIGALKRATRLGMGRCQGRYCAPVAAEILARRTGRPVAELSFFAPRGPLKPIPIGAIATPAAEAEPEGAP
mgnify:CR=1 FL=1